MQGVRKAALIGVWLGTFSGSAMSQTEPPERTAAVSVSPALRAALVTSVGRQTDPDFPRDSFGLEPSLSWQPGSSTLRARAVLERPFDPHRKLRAPLVELLALGLARADAPFGGFVQFSALDLQDWSTEGVQTRLAVGGVARFLRGSFSAELSAGPFVSLNEFERRRRGDVLSRAGFLEQVSLGYQWGPVKFELLALVVQDWNGQWRNLYSSFERVTVRLFRNLSLGLSHQLLRSHVDEDTGQFAPIGVFDGRRSRLAGFMLWQI